MNNSRNKTIWIIKWQTHSEKLNDYLSTFFYLKIDEFLINITKQINCSCPHNAFITRSRSWWLSSLCLLELCCLLSGFYSLPCSTTASASHGSSASTQEELCPRPTSISSLSCPNTPQEGTGCRWPLINQLSRSSALAGHRTANRQYARPRQGSSYPSWCWQRCTDQRAVIFQIF